MEAATRRSRKSTAALPLAHDAAQAAMQPTAHRPDRDWRSTSAIDVPRRSIALAECASALRRHQNSNVAAAAKRRPERDAGRIKSSPCNAGK
jgi:hypothetical protein